MDPNHHQRPVATAYYPSPPSHDDHQNISPSIPTSRPQTMAMPYVSRESVAPVQTPAPMPNMVNSSNGNPPIQARGAATSAQQPAMNGQAQVNGHAQGAATAKQNRLSKACDGCSVRKVKCDEEGPPCRACRSLQIPCTFNRPSRRRGPPNRHAEAIKRQKLETDGHSTPDSKPNAVINGVSTHSPTTPSAADSPAVSQYIQHQHFGKPSLTAESICPLELLVDLVDDFFTYTHPLHPFPHEPSFRTAFLQERRDTRDPRFLALLASMIGCLASTYPRQPLRRLKDAHCKHLFRSSHDFVSRCKEIALEARGNNLYAHKDLNIYDAATSYFLGQIATNTFTVAEGELYFGECFNVLRALGYSRFSDDHGHSSSAPSDPIVFGQAPSNPQHANLIDREVGYRVYWALYAVVRSAFTFGFGSGIADININPPTPLKRHAPFPLEVDDDRIFPDHVEPQPPNTPTTISALNHVCRMHTQFEPIKAFKLAWLVDESYDKAKQNDLYRTCTANAVSMFEDNLPPPFRMGPSAAQPPRSLDRNGILSPSVGSAPHFPSPSTTPTAHLSKRQIGLEIQKANLHVTFVTARVFYLEKFWGSNGMKEEVVGMSLQEIQEERLKSGRKLLDVLTTVRVEWIEPCAFGFCMQVRQVASALYSSGQVARGNASAGPGVDAGAGSGDGGAGAGVDGVVKREEDDKLAEGRATAQAYVSEFLKALMTLEKGRRGAGPAKEGAEMDEEEELMAWTAGGVGEEERKG